MFEWFGESGWRRVKRFYGDQWRFIDRYVKKYFLLALAVFIVFSVAGFVFYSARPVRAGRDVKILAERIFGDFPENASPVWEFLYLFWRNLRASAVGLAAGIVPFLFLPVLGTAVNGAALGLVAAFVTHTGGLWSMEILAAGMLPHGVLELPAVWLADALGLFLCAEIGRRMRRSRNRAPLTESAASADPRDEVFLGDVAVTFGSVVVPLLLVAAAVEAFLTPLILGLFS